MGRKGVSAEQSGHMKATLLSVTAEDVLKGHLKAMGRL